MLESFNYFPIQFTHGRKTRSSSGSAAWKGINTHKSWFHSGSVECEQENEVESDARLWMAALSFCLQLSLSSHLWSSVSWPTQCAPRIVISSLIPRTKTKRH